MGAGDAAKDYAAGFAAGVATVITGHPFDTVKVFALIFFLFPPKYSLFILKF